MRYLFSLFLFYTLPAIAQQPTAYILKGYLGVAGGESFTYRLEFKDSAGFINGYSYTYMWEKNEIKATIAGTIDRDKKTIAFRETGIVYNHGFESNTTICLLDAVLTYHMDGISMVLDGSFKSSDAGNVYCGRGSLSFTGNTVIDGLFAKRELANTNTAKPTPHLPSKPAKQTPMRIVYDTTRNKTVIAPPVAVISVSTPKKITTGTEAVYEWNTDLINLSIWDGGRMDGDVVTILFDDQVIAKRYPLVTEQKNFSFPLTDKNMHTITIIANHEGSELPNTADIMLMDGEKKYRVVAYNAISKRVVIRVRKK